ncbi:MAG TPA: hypothetical protein VMR70_09000 [Flavisolibacter sp.]|nr:hypothetical protein [Flavisolibacter sp.]
MKKSCFSFAFLLLLSLLIAQTGLQGQARHPGPRITCPICNAFMISKAVKPAQLKKMPAAAKAKYVKTAAPKANPQEVIKILDEWEKLDLKKVSIDQDESFSTYIIEFGDGKKNSFYTITNANTGAKMSGNKANELFDKLMANNKDKQSVYLLVDDMYTEKSARFISNVELYNSNKQSTKIKGVGCDIIVDNAGSAKRLGSTIIEPGAKIDNVSTVTRTKSGQVTEYTATADFSVSGKKVKVSFFGKTLNSVKTFIAKLKSIFTSSPNTSIAKAINQSRHLTNQNIQAVFEEAGFTQWVNQLKLPKYQIEKKEPLFTQSTICFVLPFLKNSFLARM